MTKHKHMFLTDQGRREGDSGQRDKLCSENVWEAGSKKESNRVLLWWSSG